MNIFMRKLLHVKKRDNENMDVFMNRMEQKLISLGLVKI